MSSTSSSGSSGVSFMGLLTIVFITLKLTDYIDWSWWLVLLPLYGGFALVIFIILVAAAISIKN